MFCYTDFTIPPELRQTYADPKIWKALRGAVWKLLHTKYGAIFGVEASHPVGDDNPTVFHPHLNFLWVIRDGFRSYIDVATLQDQFREILNYPGAVNLYHSYGTDEAQLMHLCKYITRIFPEFADWTGALRWFGKYPHLKKIDICVCPECLKKPKLLGYISSDEIKTYDLYGFRLGRSPPWENDKKITPFRKFNIN